MIDCIVQRLRRGSTIADVTLVYESDPVPSDQFGNPPPDSVDAAVSSVKKTGRMGSMAVDGSTITIACALLLREKNEKT